LPEVTALIPHSVDTLGVLTMGGPDGTGKSVSISGYDDQMHVIRHQAVGDYF